MQVRLSTPRMEKILTEIHRCILYLGYFVAMELEICLVHYVREICIGLKDQLELMIVMMRMEIERLEKMSLFRFNMTMLHRSLLSCLLDRDLMQHRIRILTAQLPRLIIAYHRSINLDLIVPFDI